VIIAELGDIHRYEGKDGAEKLVAFVGLDPKVKESGLYQGRTKMSKCGSGILRHAIRQVAFSAVMVAHDPMFTKIYKNKSAKVNIWKWPYPMFPAK
jgi:transposase